MNQIATALQDAGYVDTRPWKLVTHHYPDTDALVCLWAAARFVVKDAEYELAFVPAGDALPDYEGEGYRVLQMDTGKGELDQHEKSLKRASSFLLFCQKYRLVDDPGIQPILEMTRKADNVEEMSRTETHYVLRGLPYHFTDRKTKEVDWQAVCAHAFIALDILYSQANQMARSLEEFTKKGRRYELSNGIVIATCWWMPQLRDAAFKSGADVVMFTQNVDRQANRFYVGIQCNRNTSITLEAVIDGIRLAEGAKRKVDTAGHDLRAIGSDPLFGGWFMHDSRKLVACGTRGHQLEDTEFTQLSPHEILDVLRDRLVKTPKKKS